MGLDSHPVERHVFLAHGQDLHLLGDLSQSTQDDLVALDEVEDRVPNSDPLAEVPHQKLCLAQVMAGKTGEQVMDGLELQPAVDEVQPSRAVDVHGGSQLFLGE